MTLEANSQDSVVSWQNGNWYHMRLCPGKTLLAGGSVCGVRDMDTLTPALVLESQSLCL
jgi:hypothetical protein